MNVHRTEATLTDLEAIEANPNMTQRGYTLIDVSATTRLWPDRDLIVRLLEYLRQNLRSIVPDLPEDSELDLIACETAYNPFPVALLVLYVPLRQIDQVPDPLHMIDRVQAWCDRHSDAELRALARATPAPSWTDLLSRKVFPLREPV